MEDVMRRLFPVLIREFTDFAWECAKWAIVGVVFLASMWFLIDGLPRVVAIINGQTPAHTIHPITSQLEFPHL